MVIAGITLSQKISHTVFRKNISQLQVTEKTHVDIIEYRFANHVRQNVEFQPLPTLNDINHSAGLLWELSFNFNPPLPNWQGMMHTCDHPGQSSIFFLPMINMYPGDKTCIYSTLLYICNLASDTTSHLLLHLISPCYGKHLRYCTKSLLLIQLKTLYCY